MRKPQFFRTCQHLHALIITRASPLLPLGPLESLSERRFRPRMPLPFRVCNSSRTCSLISEGLWQLQRPKHLLNVPFLTVACVVWLVLQKPQCIEHPNNNTYYHIACPASIFEHLPPRTQMPHRPKGLTPLKFLQNGAP